MGTSYKFTPDVQEKLIEGARRGLHKQVVAWNAGISPQALERWLREGEKDEENEFCEFTRAFRKAEAEAEGALADRLMHLGTGEEDGMHHATVEFLKRRWPKRWGDKSVLEQSGPDGGPIQHEVSPQDIRRVLRERFGGGVAPVIGDEDSQDAGSGDSPDGD